MVSYDLQDLGRFGYIGKFPAKSSIANGRWCSSRCKKEVSDTVIRNIYSLKEQASHLRLPQKRGTAKGRFCTGRCKSDVGDTVIRDIFTLKSQGNHLRLPMKSTLQAGRYCTSVVKEKVFAKTIRHHQNTRAGVKILVVSGERRGESVNRSKYNEIELSTCNATVRGDRLVHYWRMVIDYSERDVWEVLKRHRCVPHPCYSLGWNRCSCAMCIFSKREQWAGIRELFPNLYDEVRRDEERLGFTLNVYKTLDEYVGDAKSCVYHGDPKAMRQMLTGEFNPGDIYTDDWKYPAGAFHGSEGGPC